jgi:hypothetical protein
MLCAVLMDLPAGPFGTRGGRFAGLCDTRGNSACSHAGAMRLLLTVFVTCVTHTLTCAETVQLAWASSNECIKLAQTICGVL